MIKRVEHVAIMVRDMERAIQFYENVFQFQVTVSVTTNDKEIVFLSHDGLPGFEVELICDLQPVASYAGQGIVNHLAFAVEDMDAAIARLQQEDGVVFERSEPKRGMNNRKTIRFRGPNGEALQLVEERSW